MNENISIDEQQNEILTPLQNSIIFDQQIIEEEFLTQDEINALRMMDQDEFQKFCSENNINSEQFQQNLETFGVENDQIYDEDQNNKIVQNDQDEDFNELKIDEQRQFEMSEKNLNEEEYDEENDKDESGGSVYEEQESDHADNEGQSTTVQSQIPDKQQQKEGFLREMTYSVYGENLENSLKLLSQQKTIQLIDKKDPKSKRAFVTAQCQQVYRSKKVLQRIAEELQQVQPYSQPNLYQAHIIDKNARLSIQSKFKRQIGQLNELSSKYCLLDDYKQNVIADFVPQKKKEFNSFLNIQNLETDEKISNDMVGFFNDYQNRVYQVAASKMRVLRIMQPQLKIQNNNISNGYATQPITQRKQNYSQIASQKSIEVDVYRRFRYNFYYWLKNFKQTEDGQFQFVDPATNQQEQKLANTQKNLIGVVLDQNHRQMLMDKAKSNINSLNNSLNANKTPNGNQTIKLRKRIQIVSEPAANDNTTPVANIQDDSGDRTERLKTTANQIVQENNFDSKLMTSTIDQQKSKFRNYQS
ncbi:UNKNOWN [Stylonychia lemnae]|uniref:Uncharacterized protein n=1 Tax=Stylonychia lemnae TaxID=5949 RepID=A0A078AD52_STYLE|nr:UNKNOWN [Stylonychia lemnae]|eukprot:CDW78793.1 UNKNOWN [Stylonychia lemnae]